MIHKIMVSHSEREEQDGEKGRITLRLLSNGRFVEVKSKESPFIGTVKVMTMEK